ncbi:M36 family metallopeptidase [Paractinoplanes hotanensis]|uniref:M36 family metallopeptidase n=1 Tax=Paractinoplanes hotanensis TaxID=2906497 RepID=A0ABT0YE41_9ACTN|nr:M36 family metallopeptidase [Actinoplanes hotanensis]MCM4084326.1 M36 family metallopeptidase [Actinoplanes hotanensis]
MKALPVSTLRRVATAATGVVLLAGLLPATAQAAPVGGGTPVAGSETKRRADFDSRSGLRAAGAGGALTMRDGAPAASAERVRNLRGSLGVQGIVDIDESTGTPRRVTRLDGFLTGPSKRKPVSIALDYLRAHRETFGLDAAALASFVLRQDYVDIAGTHHLSLVQQVNGVPVFGNGFKAHVSRNGRLIQIDGSPVATVPGAVGPVKLTAQAARAEAVKDVFGTSSATVGTTPGGATRTTRFSDRGQADLALFLTAAGLRPAWRTVVLDTGYLHVVDAATGEVLFRQDLVDAHSADVWDNYPGAKRGGKQVTVKLDKWLPKAATRLEGNVAHVYSDVNDDDVANAGEEVGPSAGRSFRFPLRPFDAGDNCSARYVCSWNPSTPDSWKVNREQNAVQVMYFLGTWHDHLEAAPIGFTRPAGNFEAVDGDAVQAQTDDGADTADGLPDDRHANNANMFTPPDGIAPTMQMFLWNVPAFTAGNSGDSAEIVYHEYTHGLSSRLVVDAGGNHTLTSPQSQAMGEGWSDWYAFDYLVAQSLQKETAAAGELKVGEYITGGDTIRSQPTDCPVGSTSTACPGTTAAGRGGYTYGDYGKISPRGAEIHADGEIWAQILWDLRQAVGSRTAQSLVTRAMELSPSQPSFLDERNSILQADLVVNGGKLNKKIWEVFARRGLGYFAATIDAGDTQPVEDFSMPPASGTPRATLTGRVADEDSGAPVAGIRVSFSGHDSGFASDHVAVTDKDGAYRITGILPGTYPKIVAQGSGYDPVVKTITVRAGAKLDWQVRRNWASASGGGTVASFTGPDYAPACGPAGLIDQSQSTGWGSDVAAGGQQVVVRLPARVAIAELVINPSATCGDDPSSATGGYRVEVSADGTTWRPAATGTFTPGTAAPTPVALDDGAGVEYIRYSMLTSQGQDAGLCDPGQPGDVTGCAFLDSTELAVYGNKVQ